MHLNKTANDIGTVLLSDAEGDFDAQFEINYTFLVGRNVRASDLLMTRVSLLQMEILGFQDTPFVRIAIKTEPNKSGLSPEKQRILAKVRTDLDSFTAMEVTALLAHGFYIIALKMP
jgi:hypothetical protein